MPELPEVETVKNGLIKKVLNKKITNCNIIYPGIIAYPTIEEFINIVVQSYVVSVLLNIMKKYGNWFGNILNRKKYNNSIVQI